MTVLFLEPLTLPRVHAIFLSPTMRRADLPQIEMPTMKHRRQCRNGQGMIRFCVHSLVRSFCRISRHPQRPVPQPTGQAEASMAASDRLRDAIAELHASNTACARMLERLESVTAAAKADRQRRYWPGYQN